MPNILAVGAHPDDVELGCGGAISRHLRLGDNVYVLILTNGEKGNHDFNKKECLGSLERLRVKPENIIFGNFPDGFIQLNQELISFIERKIIELNIQRVYTHYHKDRHQDHRNTSLAVSSAARKIPSLLLYQGPSTAVDFEPHYFVTLEEEELYTKLSALGCYKTQPDKGIVNLDWVKSVALVNGTRIYRRYAEAFALNHMIAGDEHV